MRHATRRLAFAAAVAVGALFLGSEAWAQAVTVPEVGTAGSQAIKGYSWEKDGQDKRVTNESGQEVGKAVDLLIGPDLKVSHVVVESGETLGMGGNTIAVPVDKLGYAGGAFTMRGVTVDDMKKMATFKYLKN